MLGSQLNGRDVPTPSLTSRTRAKVLALTPPSQAGGFVFQLNRTAGTVMSLAAPVRPGVYVSRWRLKGPEGALFGPELLLQIVVK
jgi:hypothetical protein